MALLYWRMGDPLAFVHAQSAWGHQAQNPVSAILSGFDDISLSHRHIGKAYDSAWALLGVAAVVWLSMRGRWMEGWLCGGTILLALSSAGLDSIPRYVSCNPAFLFAAADVVEAIPGRLPPAAILLFLGVLELVLVGYWYRGANFLI
jgi:hypothetical protein